jgi:hypothetical protein
VKEAVFSWLPSIAQNLVAAALIASVVLLYRRIGAASRSAYRRDFEKQIIKITALQTAGPAEVSRLIVYVGSKLAVLVTFGGLGVTALLTALVNSTLAGSGWNYVALQIFWLVFGAVALRLAGVAYLDIAMLYNVYVKDYLTLSPEQHEKLKSAIDQHFERLGKQG